MSEMRWQNIYIWRHSFTHSTWHQIDMKIIIFSLARKLSNDDEKFEFFYDDFHHKL